MTFCQAHWYSFCTRFIYVFCYVFPNLLPLRAFCLGCLAMKKLTITGHHASCLYISAADMHMSYSQNLIVCLAFQIGSVVHLKTSLSQSERSLQAVDHVLNKLSGLFFRSLSSNAHLHWSKR